MKRLFSRKRTRLWLIAAAVLLVLAAFFKFALIGYGITVLMLTGIAVLILLYLLLPRKFRVMLTSLLCVGVILFIAAEVPVVKAAKGTPEMEADYIIVLGAGVNGSVPSLSMIDRLSAALSYLESHPTSTAVVTGGQGSDEDISEAEAMFRWLTAHGIEGPRIIREDRATNTKENLEFSFALIPDAEAAAIAVVSSEYHLYRAQYIALAMGYEVGGIPGRTTYPVLKLNYFIREALGVVHFTIFGI